ncbi:acyltransferase [Cohnella sp. REN36]|uniref:acyltransferase n=1 Tax=Cohnella sp. REN36 TaxID=2887347 RepID=UPI001D13A107|nr:acyltransferase [Cohnella sp. REN36]MCC3377323.1 acyltransferase [Cohnella sp. REN36]
MSTDRAAPRGRERAIDLFKGLLVVGMVYCHSLQFFSDQTIYPAGERWIDLINLITFSGFVFSFGYVSQLAYYAKPFAAAAPRMLLTAGKTLLAFYVSGTAFRLFVDGRELSWDTVRPILLLRDMPGWSEFLASFAYLMIVGLILFRPLRWLAEHPWIAAAAGILLLTTTWIPYGGVHVPQLGPLLGTRDFASFPVLQYFPFYLAGMLFARHRVVWNWRVLAGAAVATAAFVWKTFAAEAPALPERFPPSIWWIVGPALILYGYYLLARLLDRFPRRVAAPLAAMGRNVLWFLVMTNVLLFALKGNQKDLLLSTTEGIWLALALLSLVGFSVWIVTKPPRESARATAATRPSA